MARATMAALIGRVREMIADDPTDTDCRVFSDDSLQTFLDDHRTEMEYVPLCWVEKRAPITGVISRFTWFGGVNWEADIELTDETYTVLTPSASDYQTGRFTFATAQDAVYATGKVYDVYGAAADALEVWAAKLAGEFDFAPGDGQSFKRSQQREGKLILANEYRQKQSVTTVAMVRSDTR